jgi:pimeloyl-ACP methyl ester carboxylesterase
MTSQASIQPLMPFPRQSVRVAGFNGVSIAAQAWGPADAPAVLLIHGFLGGRFSWAPLICSPLASKANLVTVELRGHGASDKPEESSAYADSNVWADDIAAVVSALGLKQFILVAHSYGGVVAFDYLRHKGSSAVKGCSSCGTTWGFPGLRPAGHSTHIASVPQPGLFGAGGRDSRFCSDDLARPASKRPSRRADCTRSHLHSVHAGRCVGPPACQQRGCFHEA